MLYYWLYLSAAKAPPGSTDDALIYLQSQNRNHRLRITGYLHREDDLYVQYVEGPADSIENLRDNIVRDPRHEAVHTLSEGPLHARRFSGWDMIFTSDGPSFALFQVERGGETDIALARPDEIVAFMEAVAHDGGLISERAS